MPADTLVETPTEEPIAEVQVAIATETPAELLHTETPTPLATEAATATSEDTPTATASPTPTASPSPTAAPSSTATATATATNTPSGNGGATGFRGTLLAGHNDARGEAGVGPLDLNGTLNQIAQERAESMASQDRMTHHNADGSTVFEMMSDSGYGYTDGAENIAYNAGYSDSESVEAVMDQWIESPSHYENITKAHLTKVGFGMATSASGKVYYSAVFSD
jgi:uncharacterized protein YkwD